MSALESPHIGLMDEDALRRLNEDLGPQQEYEERSDTELLKMALVNEKACPEILPFQTDLIGRIESVIDYQV